MGKVVVPRDLARECVVRTGRSPPTSGGSPIRGRVALTCEVGGSPSEPRSHDRGHATVITGHSLTFPLAWIHLAQCGLLKSRKPWLEG